MQIKNVKHRIFLSFGMLSVTLFIGISMLDGLTRKGYYSAYHTISHLSIGDRAWLGISTSIIIGLLVIGFGYSLYNVRINGSVSALGATLMLILGISTIVAAVFVVDPSLDYPPGAVLKVSFHGVVHSIATMIKFVALSGICFAWRRNFKDVFTIWYWYSLIMGVIVIVACIIFIVYLILAFTGINAPSGLFERFSMYTSYIWIFTFSFFLLNNQSKYIEHN